MKYFGGCDVGSTYTKCVIIDENGKIVAHTTIRSKINAEISARDALEQTIAQVEGLKDIADLAYLVGTGYGRNKVPQAQENISEISCHAMGVHVTNPDVKAIIDIGGQDVKGIAIDSDGTVKTFAMNDKCAAGTGRFFEAMANAFECTLDEFSQLSLTAKNVHPHYRPMHRVCRVRGHHLGGRRKTQRRDRRRHPAGRCQALLRHGEESRRPGSGDPHRRLCQERRSEASH